MNGQPEKKPEKETLYGKINIPVKALDAIIVGGLVLLAIIIVIAYLW